VIRALAFLGLAALFGVGMWVEGPLWAVAFWIICLMLCPLGYALCQGMSDSGAFVLAVLLGVPALGLQLLNAGGWRFFPLLLAVFLMVECLIIAKGRHRPKARELEAIEITFWR
jgi:hypothetical protein